MKNQNKKQTPWPSTELAPNLGHTPGPWELSDEEGYPIVSGKAVICYMEKQPGTDEVNCNDSYLIAAAPDMLEALKFLVNEYGEGGMLDGSEALSKAVTAIAKAEQN